MGKYIVSIKGNFQRDFVIDEENEKIAIEKCETKVKNYLDNGNFEIKSLETKSIEKKEYDFF
jgi:hypothetical protein